MRLGLLLLLLAPLLVHGEPLLDREFQVSNVYDRVVAMSADKRYIAIVASLKPNLHGTTQHPSEWLSVYDLVAKSWSNATFPGKRVAVTFSPDSQYLVLGRPDGSVEAYDLVTNTRVVKQQVGSAPIGAVSMANVNGADLLFISTAMGAYLLDFPSLMSRFQFPRLAARHVLSSADVDYSYQRFTSAVHANGSIAVETDASLGLLHLYDLSLGQEVLNSGEAIYSLQGITTSRSNRPSLFAPQTFLNVGLSSSNRIVALRSDLSSSRIESLEFSAQGIFQHSKDLANPMSFDPRHYSLSAETNRVLVFLAASLRGRDDCAEIFHGGLATQPLLAGGLNWPITDGSVLLSADGKFAVTLNDSFLRTWSIP